MIFLIPAIIGMIFAGFWIWIIGYVVYWVLFIQIWENRTLCSHCPHYSEKDKKIRCYGNYGIFKLWKYDPKPMTKSHQIQFIIGIAILLLYPIPFMILGSQFLMIFLSILGIFIWIGAQLKRMCMRCVNFSCPMNRVLKDFKNLYLQRNKVMSEAWKIKNDM